MVIRIGVAGLSEQPTAFQMKMSKLGATFWSNHRQLDGFFLPLKSGLKAGKQLCCVAKFISSVL